MSSLQLRNQLVSLGVDINRQIDVIIDQARNQDIQAHSMRTSNGDWVLTPLLLAKAQVLNALATLEVRKTSLEVRRK
jgi:hypothetical protein